MSLFRIVDRDGEMLSEADSLDRVPRLSAVLDRSLPCRRDFRGPAPIGTHVPALGLRRTP